MANATTALKSRIRSELPYYPRCSNNKTACRSMPSELAIRQPYIQVNNLATVSWLIFDLDHDNPLIWEEQGLPPPNMVVRNPKNNHSHYYYAISPVCISDKARRKPIEYMEAVKRAFINKLGADPAYNGPISKTPFHSWWRTQVIHQEEYSLGELADYVELNQRRSSKLSECIEKAVHSRNCTLFEKLRFYAYSIVKDFKSHGKKLEFQRAVSARAEAFNNFAGRGFSSDLKESEVRATVKSICKWTWNKYTGNRRKNLGIMMLPSEMTIEEKQSQSAKRTHKERKNKAIKAIQKGIVLLESQGKKVTQIAIASVCALSRQTVAKYLKILGSCKASEIEDEKGDKNCKSKDVSIEKKNVNNGVYQMTTLFSGSEVNSYEKGYIHSEGESVSPRSGRFSFLYQRLVEISDVIRLETGIQPFLDSECRRLSIVAASYKDISMEIADAALGELAYRKTLQACSDLSIDEAISYFRQICRSIIKESMNNE